LPTKIGLPTETAAGVRYAYKASLIGAAHQFELTAEGLSWHVGSKSGVWPYADIAELRLSYRPVSMQSRRFRTDVEHGNGQRISIFSTSWQTVALMVPQDREYRAFIAQLHRRLDEAGSRAALIAGIALLVLVAIAITGLLARAVATGAFAGALFLVGFAALFAWQIGSFIQRNKPRTYTFDNLPKDLFP